MTTDGHRSLLVSLLLALVLTAPLTMALPLPLSCNLTLPCLSHNLPAALNLRKHPLQGGLTGQLGLSLNKSINSRLSGLGYRVIVAGLGFLGQRRQGLRESAVTRLGYLSGHPCQRLSQHLSLSSGHHGQRSGKSTQRLYSAG